jgi:hypothetical protein
VPVLLGVQPQLPQECVRFPYSVFAKASLQSTQAPGFYRFKVGARAAPALPRKPAATVPDRPATRLRRDGAT